ncbi:proximal sequence element A Pbp95 isoform X2 [Rhynchophorus ferrugineus]|uniref:proximal sequence element A Pbp95 isoform X2 n=1 Tax=Rhynchophorus ferrugineus TaxID=354439 RepID=UPI003FCCD3DA
MKNNILPTMNEAEDLKEIELLIEKQKLEEQECDEVEYSEFIDDYDSDEFIGENEDYEIPDYQKQDVSKLHTSTPSSILTVNEKKIVDMCKDPDLRELLILNRQKNMQLMQFFKVIKDLLIECQTNIMQKDNQIKAKNNDKRNNYKIWRIGRPYFKSADNFPCPRNEDTMQKHQKGELMYYDMIPSIKWFNNDAKRLMAGVAFIFKVIREEQLTKEISAMEQSDNVNHRKLKMLKQSVDDIRNSSEVVYPPRNFDKSIDWNRISHNFLCNKYSPEDCEIFWNIYLHPHINKGQWSGDENTKLKSIVLRHHHQNWDAIAKELGNNRTGFVSCIHYYRNVEPPKEGRFKPSEDKLLCDLVKVFKQGSYIPWTRIAYHFKNRTRGQLCYRYKYFLSCKDDIVKGKFTPAEDVLLMILVDRFGTRFSKCQEYFTNRCSVQLKARYTTNLKTAIKRASFTVEEDQRIIDYVEKNGPSQWVTLARTLSRTGGQIRQRYKILNDFFKGHPGASLEEAPRRKGTVLSFDKEFDFLRCIANVYKNHSKIPTLKEIEKVLLNSQNKIYNNKLLAEPQNHKQIDNLLTNFFCAKMNNEKTNQANINLAVIAVRQVLSILQAELCIPKELKDFPELNGVDHRILKSLTAREPKNEDGACEIKRDGNKINSLLPPNLFNVVGLLNLVDKNLFKMGDKDSTSIEEQSQQADSMLWCMRTYLSNVPEATRNKLNMERSLFYQRLLSVLKFPTILTRQKTSEVCLFRTLKTTKIQTYSRKSRIELSRPSTSKCTKEITNKVSEHENISSNEGTVEISSATNINDVLTDFFSTTNKLERSNSTNPVHISDSVSTSKNLNTEHSIPKNLENISSLDPVDVRVLTRLTPNQIINAENNYVFKRNNIDVITLVDSLPKTVPNSKMQIYGKNVNRTLGDQPSTSECETSFETVWIKPEGTVHNTTNTIPTTIAPLKKSSAQRVRNPEEQPAQQKLVENANEESLNKFVSNIDDLLTDFFSAAMKLKFQSSVNQAHVNHAVVSVQAILSALNVELCIPKEFPEITNLDVVDVDILKSLVSKASMNEHNEYVIKRSSRDINSQIPPNLYTAVGMRSLLIKNHIYKSTKKENNVQNRKNAQDSRTISYRGRKHQPNKTKFTQKQLKEERILFHKRLMSLFKFPGILTLQKPPDGLTKNLSSNNNKAIRTYRKKNQPKAILPSEENGSPVIDSMAEKLKRRINDAIKNLTTHSPAKRFCSSKTKTASKQVKGNGTDQPNTEKEKVQTPSGVSIGTNRNEAGNKTVSENVSLSADLEDLNALNEALKCENVEIDESFDID